MVRKAGNQVGIKLRPHNLRRHAETHASRSGVPVEIVSKVTLRHSNLAVTKRYLGNVCDTEALRWIDNLYSQSTAIQGESESGFTLNGHFSVYGLDITDF